MPTHTSTTDPRTIVTPDAFEVSEGLLGMPLASPRRRLVAILVDLAVIGFITLVTSSFALILGVVAAVFFIRVSLKRTRVPGSVFGRAMRLSLGCLGLFIGVVTALVWVAVSVGPELEDLGRLDDAPGVAVGGGSGQDRLGELAGLLGEGVGLVTADDADEAREAMTLLVRRGRRTGESDAEIRAAILELSPDAAPWSDQAEELVDQVLAAGEGDTPVAGAAPPDPGSGGPAGAGEGAAPTPGEEAAAVEELSVPDALEEYAALLRAGAEPADEPRLAELRAYLLPRVAGDTLDALQTEVEALAGIAERRREAIDRLEDAVVEAEEGSGFFAWLRSVVDELGFGFGWASLYMTVILSWWKGQTVGKKLMGVRVVRLDGEAITWWTAFERAGGYAAGFATGLLGFAQVWWDANRQTIHDRIVGTVVVVDGAEPVGNWEQAL